ncbi:MAG: UTP--glucose-1-phosphate uridylyltransferase [Planctomycetes bacterium]|nr:UTP--glucose-1-phosphate uridylyltransferase [Planctomycetota bacterium]
MNDDQDGMLEDLPDRDRILVRTLIEGGQEHLFEEWFQGGRESWGKSFLAQIDTLDRAYPGGIKAYIANGRRLLEESRRGLNPFSGFTPEVPEGICFDEIGEPFFEFERLGLERAGELAFVLVAGGLGERLGYSGIKVALPSQLLTGYSFLESFMKHIDALDKAAARFVGHRPGIPLAIMTSDDTHDMTEGFLSKNDYFGWDPSRVSLIRQGKVACFKDADAHLAMHPNDKLLETKPHGHGDVHLLLHESGLARRWLEEGRRHIVFFQDTNGLVFNVVLAALGVSIKQDLDVNSVTVPRCPGEAAGGIVRLVNEEGSSLTVNVEYNQLDPLLRATVDPAGDRPDASGNSPYPGNINVLVFAAAPYVAQLDRSGGAIPEFVNPKYADKSRNLFLKNARLESLMQDYPRLLESSNGVGYSRFPRWLCFSPVKNRLEDAASKSSSGLPPECAGSGEFDIYHAHAHFLELSGMHVEWGETRSFGGVVLARGPLVYLNAEFAVTVGGLREKIRGGSISARSALIVEGEDVEIEGLKLDGALVIRAISGAKVRIRGLEVHNLSWTHEPLKPGEGEEELSIRGFRLFRRETRELVFDKTGEYFVEA